jgi:uncharacterized protein YbbC (DUF1343 family)
VTSLAFGIDRFTTVEPLMRRLRGARVGILAHAASVDHRLRHLLDVLEDGDVRPVLLFGPEHGFGGAAQDMAVVGDDEDAVGRRIVSLYGDTLEALIPGAADLREIELLVVDLVDVGARYYTFVWTALLAARAARDEGVHTVILDRPNPIGGTHVEGRVQQPGFESFVGWERVPIRHALTYGEMVALWIARDGVDLGPDGALSIVSSDGWSRDVMADGWGRPFVLPSPNMPTLDTAVVYPGGCLIEGTNLSEGRGHTRPFELVGAPFVDGERLARDLDALQLGGFVPRPVTFIPTFHKHGGTPCGGVQIHVTDRERFRPVAVYTALVALCHHQAPDAFRFRTERYEFVDDIPAFDLLTGSAEARERIEAGAAPREVAELVSTTDSGWSESIAEAQDALARASW